MCMSFQGASLTSDSHREGPQAWKMVNTVGSGAQETQFTLSTHRSAEIQHICQYDSTPVGKIDQVWA